MSSKAACARPASACASRRSSSTPTTGSHLWAERYDRDLADVFAVQDEITDAIVAAIEPQLYAAENFRAQRKPPDNLDAWDLVMRALWHFWRVTREDNRRRAGDCSSRPSRSIRTTRRRSPCSRSATSSAPRWAGRTAATVTPIAERAALAAVRVDSEDPWAHLALALRLCLSRPHRRLARRVRDRAAPQSELLAGARLLRPGAVLERALARGRGGRSPRDAASAARSLLPRSTMESPPTPPTSGATMRRRSRCRARQSASAAISSAATAC